jgi:LDH2 family malate/lactate/ureidoglycolate dehydrogenase
VLAALGTPVAARQVVADGLVTACLWWHPGQGQGLEKLFRYARRVHNGGIVPDATMTWEVERSAVALLNAEKGFGYVAAHRAMARAIELAKSSGIATVGVRNSNHFGIAGHHARRAAREGMIGIAMTNAGAEMAPWRSATPVLGTNPWGIAVPRPSPHDPVILDMALTQSGKGMMQWMHRCGLPMPAHWALTAEGQPTTNPAEALDGPLLPIGDYKGYGLSFMTDVLTGVMTGALFGRSVFQDDENFDVGHVMIAIDPTIYLSRDRFEERIERLVAEVRAAPSIDDDEPVLLPGEREQQRAAKRATWGLPIARVTMDNLEGLARDLGVPFSLQPDSTNQT